MQEDIFDIVDENDRIIGHAPRSDAHARGLRHRAVHVLIFNDEGEVFLQKRSKTKDTWPGAWDSSCSGHLCQGEDYLAAAYRELEEELGYQPERPLEMMFKLLPCDDTGQEFVEVFRVRGTGPFRLNPEELETGEWIKVQHLLERVEYTPSRFTSAFRLILVRLKALDLLPAIQGSRGE